MKNAFRQLLVQIITLIIFAFWISTPTFAVEGEFAGGDGTKNNPFLISTKTQLNNVRYHLDSHFRLINDIIFEDADFEMDGEFYDFRQAWLPIGQEDRNCSPFTGYFDGNGYSIRNLHVITCENTGLFGINEGEINNLYLEINVHDYDYDLDTFSFYVGGISAINAGSIISCEVSGSINIDMNDSKIYLYPTKTIIELIIA